METPSKCLLALCLSLVVVAWAGPIEQARSRRIAVAAGVPLRIYDGKLYDLTEVLWASLSYTEGGGPLPKFWVAGKIISVGEDFVIIEHSRWVPGLGRTPIPLKPDVVCLKHHPNQSHFLDGDRIACAAILAGRFQYDTAGGSTATIPSYDFGKPLAGSGHKFEWVQKVSADACSAVTIAFQP